MQVPASTALRVAFLCIQELRVDDARMMCRLASKILLRYPEEASYTPGEERCLTIGASPLAWAVRVRHAAANKPGCESVAEQVRHVQINRAYVGL